jgi:hypothetical protein
MLKSTVDLFEVLAMPPGLVTHQDLTPVQWVTIISVILMSPCLSNSCSFTDADCQAWSLGLKWMMSPHSWIVCPECLNSASLLTYFLPFADRGPRWLPLLCHVLWLVAERDWDLLRLTCEPLYHLPMVLWRYWCLRICSQVADVSCQS